MSRNRIQFQKGLSLSEFNARYGSEEQCHTALVKMRWPDGFVCPKCEARKHGYSGARRVFQCSSCRAQTTVKAGTVMHKSRMPLTKWFLAIYLLTQSKNDISALELARQLGVKWDTAWLMKQKLMEAMRQRNSIYKLSGDIQLDDAYLGGERPGKPGRGAAGKIPFVIAVQTRDNKPIYSQLRRVSGFTNEAIRSYAAVNIEAGSHVRSDGLACFAAVADAGMVHQPIVTGGGRPTACEFKWVNTGLGNVKSAIIGTCRSCSQKHADRYLAAYEYRYNRRFSLHTMPEHLAAAAMKSQPRTYKSIIAAETSG